MILNPLLVTIVAAAADALDARRCRRRSSSAVAMPMMGVPFLLLNVNGSILVIAA